MKNIMCLYKSCQYLFIYLFNYFSALNPLLITLALIGKSCITGAFGTAYQLSAEIYPTVVRNAGMGSSSAVARVGSMLSPYIAKSVREIFSFIYIQLPFHYENTPMQYIQIFFSKAKIEIFIGKKL